MEALLNKLNETMDAALALLEQTGMVELNKMPPNGSWSIGQVMEHIIICGNDIPDRKTAIPQREPDEKVPLLKEIFLDMNAKYTADPMLCPKSNQHDKKDLAIQLNRMKEHLSGILLEKDLQLLCMDMELPQIGLLTRYEWIWFILLHTQRHRHQAEHISKELQKQ